MGDRHPRPKSEPTKVEVKSGANKKQVSDKAEATVDWTVKIEAEGVTADSSPLITRYVCTEGAEAGTEFYHATPASDAIEGKDSVRLTEGTWEITAIPIINPDGSITTPSGGGDEIVSGDAKGSGSTEFTGETKPAEDVTQDDIDKVLDKVNEAVSKGDGTLTGDAGKDVVNKVTDNASKAPAADKEKVEEKKDAAADSAAKAEEKRPIPRSRQRALAPRRPSRTPSRPRAPPQSRPMSIRGRRSTAASRYTPLRPTPLLTRRHGTRRFVAAATIFSLMVQSFMMTIKQPTIRNQKLSQEPQSLTRS